MKGMGHCLVLILVLALTSVLAYDECKEVTEWSSKSLDMTKAEMLEKEFIVDIEVINREDSTVKNMRMFYNNNKKIIRLDILDRQEHSKLYFYFEYNEILKFQHGSKLGRGRCDVFPDLSDSVDEFWFGGTQASTKNPPIPAPLAALYFIGKSGFSDHDLKQKYIGKTMRRGKKATYFTSCQRFKSEVNDVVLNITHYFAEQMYSFPYGHMDSTLLSIEMKGNGKVNGIKNDNVDHVYNFFNFRGFDEDYNSLETPEGIPCTGRKTSKKIFPTLPNYIKFSGEVVDPVKKFFIGKEEVYDYNYQFAISKTIKRLDTDRDLNRLTKVFDFRTDTLLIVDEVDTSCQNHKISSYSDLELYHIDKNKPIMDNPSQFFLSDPKSFTYLGQKKLRGMYTDVWVAASTFTKGWTVQYHFAPKHKSWNDKIPSYLTDNWPVPVKVKVWSSPYDKVGQTENVFNVDYNALRPDYVDLSTCFKYNYHMQVVLKGTRDEIVSSYEEAFMFQVKRDIHNTAGISIHQINQMRIFYNKDIFIEFLIGAHDDTTAKNAVNAVTTALKSGKLTFKKREPKTLKWTQAIPLVSVDSVNAYEADQAPHSSDDSGYSTGAMAGVGVAMAVVGIAGGAGAGYAHGKYFG